jgi:hypothetical protein
MVIIKLIVIYTFNAPGTAERPGGLGVKFE